MVEMELDLHIKNFNEKKEQYKKRWEADCPNDEKEYASYRIVPYIDDTDVRFDDGTIKVSCSLNHDGQYIGNATITIPIDLDLASDIISEQVKKYNKVKTMLESTKG